MTERIANRYEIKRWIASGGMGAVYEARDHLNDDIVALKQVLVPSQNDPQQQEEIDEAALDEVKLSLAMEFRTLAGLRHPHIVGVMDYGFDAKEQPFFTMDLIEDASTLTAYGRNLDNLKKVALINDMLGAISYIHRRGIIHRDLKPANVLVNKDGAVQVMDFGLVIHQMQSITNLFEGGGTISYMSPEALSENLTSERSDLFAVGVMIYEMFTGVHPFNPDSAPLGQIIAAILTKTPDTSMLDNALAELVQKLLDKDPAARFGSADEVIVALCDALDAVPPAERIDIRESYLQASRFVGRHLELDQLEDALDEAANHRGSVWLVGGESGIGKSRMLDELRTRALVKGITVLRGQAIQEGGLPFQLWRNPLPRLMLIEQLNDFEAGVLKELVPDIDRLLEREVPDPPSLEDKQAQERLLATLVDFLARLSSPTLILLEDLHWAEESLEPVKALMALVGELPILVIGSYRDDEAPDLPQVLSGATNMRLTRLNEAAIADLSSAMLGKAGQDPAILELIKRESEGNVFFMVEVIRALADEAGSLSAVNSMTLPGSILAGGIKKVVGRRLERIPDDAREVLNLAAIAGRLLDEALLKTLAPETDIEAWITLVANAGVLEQQDEDWRFAHDKLREGILESLSDEKRKDMHRRVAEAIEVTYPDDDGKKLVLIEHWHQAGNVAKELEVAPAAMQLMLRSANYSGVVEIGNRLVETRDGDAEVSPDFHKILHLLGDAYQTRGDLELANHHYESALKLAHSLDNELARSESLGRIARVAAARGEFDQARQTLEDVLAIQERLADQNALAVSLQSRGNVALQMGDLKEAATFYNRALATSHEVNNLQRIAELTANLGLIDWYTGKLPQAVEKLEESLHQTRELGIRPAMVNAMHNLGILAAIQGDLATSMQRFTECLELYRSSGNRSGMADILNDLGKVTAMQEKHAEARNYYDQSLEIYREIGDQRGIVFSLVNLGKAYLADYQYPEARKSYIEALRIAQEIKAASLIIEAVTGLANFNFQLGMSGEVAEWIGAILEHPALTDDVRSEHVQPLLDQLRNAYEEDELNALLEEGKQLDLEKIVQSLLR